LGRCTAKVQMTVIVGYSDGKQWVIGADSGAFEDSGLRQTLSEPKCWRAGDYLVGVAGSIRVLNLARKFKLGEPYALRDHLSEQNIPGEAEWSVLVVSKNGMFEIDEHMGVAQLKDKYSAVGAANQIAIGALAILAGAHTEPEKAVKLALKATLAHSNLVMAPLLTIKGTSEIQNRSTPNGK